MIRIDPRLPAPRFYCLSLPHPRLNEPHCTLDAEQTRHARKVLRCQPGQGVELFDGRGCLAQATIVEFESDQTLCRVNEIEIVDPPRPRVTVASAVPKGPRADDMVNQLSQLGADRFIPMRTERSIVVPRANRIGRYTSAAIESAKQSRRLFLMQIDQPLDLPGVLELGRDLALVALPQARKTPDNLGRRIAGSEHVMLLIGPEGGFTGKEVEKAVAAGCEPWCVSKDILRIETAAVAAVAIARYFGGPTADPPPPPPADP